MKNLKNFLVDKVANAKLKVSNGKLDQATRNTLKNEATDLLHKALIQLLEGEEIIIERVQGAVGIGVNNEIGLIPIELSLVFKNLDEDIIEKGEEYQMNLKIKAEKMQAKAKKTKEAQEKRKAETKPKEPTQ